jgi:hypothetical protein
LAASALASMALTVISTMPVTNPVLGLPRFLGQVY